ncbi:hypothetical protein CDD83_6952 [Cordyceps sp. RAO-2017]|nr:hypothetical protein CDD83_6952 [Cordyceps sp. RAO-2017]
MASLEATDLPGAVGLDQLLEEMARDEQEGWEYEYSATETETYYLTLELSYPEFKDKASQPPHHSRGGYYKSRMDHPAAHPYDATTAKTGGGDDDDDDDDGHNEDDDDDENDKDNDDEPGAEAGGDDDDGPPVDPGLQAVQAEGGEREAGKRAAAAGKGKEKAREERASSKDRRDEGQAKEEIQILDLHSTRPMISYRGRLFEGQWAEVIGTEAILARHDEGRPLPALRNLAEGIDILGASASRILTTEKVARPKVVEADRLGPTKEEWNIRIPTGKDKTGERTQQIRFLENLIALKKQKGQTDHVTEESGGGGGGGGGGR